VQQQSLAGLTKAQIVVQLELGEPLGEYLSRRYHGEGATLAEIADALGIKVSTASRWLWQFGIAARRPGRRAA